MKYFRLWLIAVFILGIARIVQGQQDGTTVVRLGVHRNNLVAETTCSEDNRVVIIFHQDLDTLEYRLTMVHEQTHRKQMQGNCQAVQARYRSDPKFRIEMEREAYCEDSKARIAAGQNVQSVRERFYGLMKMLYDVDEPVCPFIPP